MGKDDFTLKDIVMEMREELKSLRDEMSEILTEHKENTTFRKKAINAIVGFFFLCLAAVGAAVLKVTGVFHS